MTTTVLAITTATAKKTASALGGTEVATKPRPLPSMTAAVILPKPPPKSKPPPKPPKPTMVRGGGTVYLLGTMTLCNHLVVLDSLCAVCGQPPSSENPNPRHGGQIPRPSHPLASREEAPNDGPIKPQTFPHGKHDAPGALGGTASALLLVISPGSPSVSPPQKLVPCRTTDRLNRLPEPFEQPLERPLPYKS